MPEQKYTVDSYEQPSHWAGIRCICSPAATRCHLFSRSGSPSILTGFSNPWAVERPIVSPALTPLCQHEGTARILSTSLSLDSRRCPYADPSVRIPADSHPRAMQPRVAGQAVQVQTRRKLSRPTDCSRMLSAGCTGVCSFRPDAIPTVGSELRQGGTDAWIMPGRSCRGNSVGSPGAIRATGGGTSSCECEGVLQRLETPASAPRATNEGGA